MARRTIVSELSATVAAVKGSMGFDFAIWVEEDGEPKLLAAHGPFISEERAEQKAEALIDELFGVLRKHLDLADEIKKKAH